MTRRVLVPLDGSDFSRQILPHLRAFLDPSDLELILLRVGDPPEGVTGTPARPPTAEWPFPIYYESERDADRAHHPIYSSQVRDSVQAELVDELQGDVGALQEAGYSVYVAVSFGDPAQEIVAFAERQHVDLVAMATHGRTGLSRLVFGSVAEQVMRRLTIPVMLVRPTETPADAKRPVPGAELAGRLAQKAPVRLAVATDGSPFARVATGFAGELARSLPAEVTVLAAFREEEALRGREVLDAARDLLDDLPSTPATVPLVGFADEEIIQHLTEQPVDLLVIGAFGDRGATRFLIGSTAQRLVQQAPASVLMVKGQAPALGKILACTDVGDEVVVDVAAHLARACGADLTVLHVLPPSAAMYLTLPDAVDIPLDQLLGQHTVLARHLATCVDRLEEGGFAPDILRIRRGAVPDTIFQEARSGAYDLIVVGDQAGPIRDQYFMGSIADRVVKYAHRSVLVVRLTR